MDFKKNIHNNQGVEFIEFDPTKATLIFKTSFIT